MTTSVGLAPIGFTILHALHAGPWCGARPALIRPGLRHVDRERAECLGPQHERERPVAGRRRAAADTLLRWDRYACRRIPLNPTSPTESHLSRGIPPLPPIPPIPPLPPIPLIPLNPAYPTESHLIPLIPLSPTCPSYRLLTWFRFDQDVGGDGFGFEGEGEEGAEGELVEVGLQMLAAQPVVDASCPAQNGTVSASLPACMIAPVVTEVWRRQPAHSKVWALPRGAIPCGGRTRDRRSRLAIACP